MHAPFNIFSISKESSMKTNDTTHDKQLGIILKTKLEHLPSQSQYLSEASSHQYLHEGLNLGGE